MESFTSANQVQTRTTIVANLPLKGFFKPQGKFNKGNKMAVLTLTTRDVNGTVTDAINTLAASDTFTYTPSVGMMAAFRNTTGGSLTVNLKGSAPSAAYAVVGTGETKDLTGGYSITVAAGAQKSINLDKIALFLAGSGTVTVTGAATLTATIYK